LRKISAGASSTFNRNSGVLIDSACNRMAADRISASVAGVKAGMSFLNCLCLVLMKMADYPVQPSINSGGGDKHAF